MLPMIVENRVAGHVLVALGALALVAAFAACDRSDGDTELGPAGPGADSAVESVQTLVDALSAGNFDDAAPLAVTGHAALATLAEGAPSGRLPRRFAPRIQWLPRISGKDSLRAQAVSYTHLTLPTIYSV